MKLLRYFLYSVLVLCVVASCINRPDYVLDEPEMIDLLVDVHRAEGLLDVQKSNQNQPAFQQAVMAAVLVKHNVSRAQYDSSLMWYAQHLKLLTRVYSHVDERLAEEYDMWGTQIVESRDFVSSEAGDTVQLWTINDYLILDAQRSSLFRLWEMEPDSNFYAGDSLVWDFDVNHLIHGQQIIASMTMLKPRPDAQRLKVTPPPGAERQPLSQASGHLAADGHLRLSVANPSQDELCGNIQFCVSLHLDRRRADSLIQQSPVFLNNISLIRYHRE